MKFAVALAALVAAGAVAQDPCAGCNEELAIKYQTCARDHGNPCSFVAAGQKKDTSCCLKKEKHDRCLGCNALDCSFETCSKHHNPKYYSERALPEPKLDDKKAMKAAGWGKL
eukprot:NODE_6822_length_480_cov_163.818824.p2 GENE.NODE_6822_length_480_cov_163.818824~~NODE_6822_length_480_cov_163.818824.p2  ORF type:complete len:113 (-),score=42.54 NODE_6822_length_480_cov_163.818824:61-399(-)